MRENICFLVASLQDIFRECSQMLEILVLAIILTDLVFLPVCRIKTIGDIFTWLETINNYRKQSLLQRGKLQNCGSLFLFLFLSLSLSLSLYCVCCCCWCCHLDCWLCFPVFGILSLPWLLQDVIVHPPDLFILAI